MATELGRDIDGAWWPRTDRMTNELPRLVAVLEPLLGDVAEINVNWPPLQRPPDFNQGGWEHKQQHLMTLHGSTTAPISRSSRTKTNNALALMVPRRAANLPISPADQANVMHMSRLVPFCFAAQRQIFPTAATEGGRARSTLGESRHVLGDPLPPEFVGVRGVDLRSERAVMSG